MPNNPLFPSHYRGSGQVALLCEGDAIGYEAQFLGRWTLEIDLGGRQVDVWACGTSSSLYGMADAIGRFVRVVVVEDRDFRSWEEAKNDCDRKYRERENRGVAMRGWTTGSRNEIENYVLDDAVLLPVMTKKFDCQEADVHVAVDKALAFLPTFQAVQAIGARARRTWTVTDPTSLLIGGKPKWTDNGLHPPDHAKVSRDLENAVVMWQKRFASTGELGPYLESDAKAILQGFDEYHSKWSGMTRTSTEWRTNWAGKEVLKLIRQQLAARAAGWWSFEKGKPVAWHRIGSRTKQDEHDRIIERELQKDLVESLFNHVLADAGAPMNPDLDRLAEMLRS